MDECHYCEEQINDGVEYSGYSIGTLIFCNDECMEAYERMIERDSQYEKGEGRIE